MSSPAIKEEIIKFNKLSNNLNIKLKGTRNSIIYI